MQTINSRSIQYIRKHYLDNLSQENKKKFTRKLVSRAEEWSKFLRQNLDSQDSDVIGTSLILYFELKDSLDGKSRIKIASLLKHENEWVRERASEAMSKFATKSALPMIISALNDKNPFVRGYLCEALGKIKSDVAKKLILKHLEDRDGLVRTSAIESAEKLKLREAIPLLKQRLNDRESLVRGYAASALCALQGKDAEQHLMKRLKKEQDWYAKIQILEALYCLSRSEDILGKILGMLKSQQDYVREGVITALEDIVGKLNVNRIYDVLRQTLKIETNSAVKKHIKSSIKTLNEKYL